MCLPGKGRVLRLLDMAHLKWLLQWPPGSSELDLWHTSLIVRTLQVHSCVLPSARHYLIFPLPRVPHLFAFVLSGSVHVHKSWELCFRVEQDVSQPAHPPPETALELPRGWGLPRGFCEPPLGIWQTEEEPTSPLSLQLQGGFYWPP